jgi:tRNA nucleotidyltransferase (CCA-adding enzyme)
MLVQLSTLTEGTSGSVADVGINLDPEVISAITDLGKLYEVGGTIRDSLIAGKPAPKDADFLVTGIPYQELSRLLREFGRVDLVGRSFGVIKFTPYRDNDEPPHTYDFVLPRKEISTGSGHRDFQVDFDHTLSVEEDLKRRDFTINAIARDIGTGEIVDPLGGRDDIRAGLLRYTSPRSFEEDPLRMLRAMQFAARFEFEIEPETYAAIKKNVKLIETITPERINEEFNKLLEKADQPSIGFKLMQQTGLLKLILPELEDAVGVTQPGPYHKWDVFEHTLYAIDAAPKDLVIRMAAVFHDIAKPVTRKVTRDRATFYNHDQIGARITKKALQRLRYGNEFIDKVTTLVEQHMFTTEVADKGLRRLIRRTGQELIFDLMELRRADTIAQGTGQTNDDVDELEQRIRDELHRKPPFGFPDLAVNGEDLMQEFELQEGPLVGLVLNHLLESVLDEPERNDYDTLMTEAKKFLDTFGQESS